MDNKFKKEVAKYIKSSEKLKLGLSEELITQVTEDLGPSIYLQDAALVAENDLEVEYIIATFLKKKLNIDGDAETVYSILDKLKPLKNKKYRALVYALLIQHYNVEIKKIDTSKFICSHASKSSYSLITPGEHLKPINGKILWHIEEASLTQDMEKYKTIFAFEQAFSKWGQVMHPIVFQATGNKAEAQIVIKFRHNGDADLPFQFEETTLAYAFAPQGTSLGIHADMYFNDGYRWDEMHKTGSIYLFKVAVHEIGHTLNLGHQTQDIKDIMYPMYQPNGEVVMNSDTKKGIYDLYKTYGVQYQNAPEGQLDARVKEFIKLMYKSRNDLLRLSITQINALGEVLGITFGPRDSVSRKATTIWGVVGKF